MPGPSNMVLSIRGYDHKNCSKIHDVHDRASGNVSCPARGRAGRLQYAGSAAARDAGKSRRGRALQCVRGIARKTWNAPQEFWAYCHPCNPPAKQLGCWHLLVVKHARHRLACGPICVTACMRMWPPGDQARCLRGAQRAPSCGSAGGGANPFSTTANFAKESGSSRQPCSLAAVWTLETRSTCAKCRI